MEEKQIPYFIHEGMVARMERMNQRLWITSIILILALIASNLAWFFYDQQFETYEETTQEVTQEASSENGDSINNVIGGDYVESKADSQNDH